MSNHQELMTQIHFRGLCRGGVNCPLSDGGEADSTAGDGGGAGGDQGLH